MPVARHTRMNKGICTPKSFQSGGRVEQVIIVHLPKQPCYKKKNQAIEKMKQFGKLALVVSNLAIYGGMRSEVRSGLLSQRALSLESGSWCLLCGTLSRLFSPLLASILHLQKYESLRQKLVLSGELLLQMVAIQYGIELLIQSGIKHYEALWAT